MAVCMPLKSLSFLHFGTQILLRNIGQQRNPAKQCQTREFPQSGTTELEVEFHIDHFSDGSLSGHGHSKGGNRHGQWTWYYKCGALKATGSYADGELEGHWEWRWKTGHPSLRGAFIHGLKTGRWTWYYETGQLCGEGTYEKGKKSGEWKTFYKTGHLKRLRVFSGYEIVG